MSPRWNDAIRHSHRVIVRCDAYYDGQLVGTDLPVVGGSISVDRASGVRRQGTVELATEEIAPTIAERLNPFGTELVISRGIEYPSGTVELCKLGTFGIVAQHRAHAGPTSYTLADRAARLIDAQFLAPRRVPYVPAIQTLTDYLAEIIHDARVLDLTDYDEPPPVIIVEAAGGGYGGPADPVPPVFFERDRWASMRKLARGREIFFDVDGNLALRDYRPVTAPPNWIVNAGVDGVLVTYSRDITRDETFNAVVVFGERTGDAPVRAIVYDDDPDSPTRFNGPFGQVPHFITSALIDTQDSARALALQTLAQKVQLQRTVQLACIPNPALDVGDIVHVVLPDDTSEAHVVDRLTIPLGDGPMTISTRTSAPTPYVADGGARRRNPATPPDKESELNTPIDPPDPVPPPTDPLPIVTITGFNWNINGPQECMLTVDWPTWRSVELDGTVDVYFIRASGYGAFTESYAGPFDAPIPISFDVPYDDGINSAIAEYGAELSLGEGAALLYVPRATATVTGFNWTAQSSVQQCTLTVNWPSWTSEEVDGNIDVLWLQNTAPYLAARSIQDGPFTGPRTITYTPSPFFDGTVSRIVVEIFPSRQAIFEESNPT